MVSLTTFANKKAANRSIKDVSDKHMSDQKKKIEIKKQ